MVAIAYKHIVWCRLLCIRVQQYRKSVYGSTKTERIYIIYVLYILFAYIYILFIIVACLPHFFCVRVVLGVFNPQEQKPGVFTTF